MKEIDNKEGAGQVMAGCASAIVFVLLILGIGELMKADFSCAILVIGLFALNYFLSNHDE